MAGMFHRISYKRAALLLLMLLLMGALFALLARPAQAVEVTIQFNQQSSFYTIMDVNNVATDPTDENRPIPQPFSGNFIRWDTDPVGTPTSPNVGVFRFALVYDKQKFSNAQVYMQAGDNVTLEQTYETALIDPFGTGLDRYPIYQVDRAGSDFTLSAVLSCQIKLSVKDTLDATISPTPTATVRHNAAFQFVVTTKEFNIPKVHQYNYPKNPDNPGTQPDKVLSYYSVDTSQVGMEKTYRFTYNIDNILGATTILVDNVMPAYIVQLPVNDPNIYDTTPGSGIHVTEYYVTDDITGFPTTQPPTKKSFSFDMQFTPKYGNSVPYASVVGDNTMIVTWISGGNRTWRVTVPPPPEEKSLTVSFNKENWHIILNGVNIQDNASYYAVNPANHYLQVEYDAPGVFYIIPTPAYAHNTKPPLISVTSGYDAAVVSEGSQWKCTIAGLKHTVDVTINVSQWTVDPNAPTGDTSIITMPTGNGYSIGNILGGYGVGNNQYRVNNGDDFIFSVNVLSGYDASTLNVSVSGQRLFPENGVYTIPKVNASLTVSISVDSGSTSSPSPSPGSSPGNTNGSGSGDGGDDGTELKYREVYDEKSGIKVSGFFVGIPEIVVTELFKTDPVYIRMLNTADVAEDKVLRAVDVQIKNATSYGTITLGLQVGVGYNTIEMLVVHATSTGDETYTVLGQDGMAVVAVRHTSPFMVADPYGRGPGSTGGTGGTNGNGNGTGSILPPATGGARSVMGFILIMVVICSILFIIWYRTRDTKAAETPKE